MGQKKTFIGYDLGDGESITDFVVLDMGKQDEKIQTKFTDMTMPDCTEPGQAMPTAYGFVGDEIVFAHSIVTLPEQVRDIHVSFKRRPSDVLGVQNDTGDRAKKLYEVFTKSNKWPSKQECPEAYSEQMQKFRNAVITFTDAIFNEPQYKEKARSAASDSDEIVFCIGHPTKWNKLDVAVYERIFGESVLGKGTYVGKPTRLVMAAESRAAFLYVRDKATSAVLPKNTSALLIDIGSSTIDVTAMTADSRHYQYNSGSNYLGARSIDYIIREWFLSKLKTDPNAWNLYEELIAYNPTFDDALTLSCRQAKEEVYSTKIGVSRIFLGDFAPKTLVLADLNKMIETEPIVPVLKSNVNIPDHVAKEMGNKSWMDLFRQFLMDKKAEIDAQKIKIGRIILTGSASKMSFVPEIVKSVFEGDVKNSNVLSDMNPSRTISQGLALVGPSNEKSEKFRSDVQKLLDKELEGIIKADVPELADKLSAFISEIVTNMVMIRISEWRSGKIKTIDEMTNRIKSDCSEQNLNKMLSQNKEYNNIIRQWAENSVGKDVAVKLNNLCKRYGVDEISIENLNVMKAPDIKNLGVPNMDVLDFTNGIITLVSVIAGIIAAIILPTVIGVVLGLILVISTTIGGLLISILLAIPGVGWTILIGIGGIMVFNAVKKGLKGAKDSLAAKMSSADLPDWVRKRMTDAKVREEMKKTDVQGKIRAALMEEKVQTEITKAVADNLREQIEKRTDDIKYIIESK